VITNVKNVNKIYFIELAPTFEVALLHHWLSSMDMITHKREESEKVCMCVCLYVWERERDSVCALIVRLSMNPKEL